YQNIIRRCSYNVCNEVCWSPHRTALVVDLDDKNNLSLSVNKNLCKMIQFLFSFIRY
ncbi:hypothetical protein C0J52_11351, partial [Blattella germanica]